MRSSDEFLKYKSSPSLFKDGNPETVMVFPYSANASESEAEHSITCSPGMMLPGAKLPKLVLSPMVQPDRSKTLSLRLKISINSASGKSTTGVGSGIISLITTSRYAARVGIKYRNGSESG